MRWRRSFVATTSPRAHRTRFMWALQASIPTCRSMSSTKTRNYRVPRGSGSLRKRSTGRVIDPGAMSEPITMQTLCI